MEPVPTVVYTDFIEISAGTANRTWVFSWTWLYLYKLVGPCNLREYLSGLNKCLPSQLVQLLTLFDSVSKKYSAKPTKRAVNADDESTFVTVINKIRMDIDWVSAELFVRLRSVNWVVTIDFLVKSMVYGCDARSVSYWYLASLETTKFNLVVLETNFKMHSK